MLQCALRRSLLVEFARGSFGIAFGKDNSPSTGYRWGHSIILSLLRSIKETGSRQGGSKEAYDKR